MLQPPGKALIYTTSDDAARIAALTSADVEVAALPADANGKTDLAVYRVEQADYDPIISEAALRELVAQLPGGEADYRAALRAYTDQGARVGEGAAEVEFGCRQGWIANQHVSAAITAPQAHPHFAPVRQLRAHCQRHVGVARAISREPLPLVADDLQGELLVTKRKRNKKRTSQ